MIAVEECGDATAFEDDDAAAFEDDALLPDTPEVVPRCAAFPRAAEVLQISCILSKYGQTVSRRFRKIAFLYKNS